MRCGQTRPNKNNETTRQNLMRVSCCLQITNYLLCPLPVCLVCLLCFSGEPLFVTVLNLLLGVLSVLNLIL